MPKRVAVTQLNARTIDVVNVIRNNMGYEYQNAVPEVTSEAELPKVGEIILGDPAIANRFINALVNRIALVRIKSALFNNAYKELKKGYLEYGETVEEVFVEMCKAREFSVEKAAGRELKRTLPKVRSAFHAMNWRAQYPVTIQYEDLRMAFRSAEGMQDLVAKIFQSLETGAEYDEYLLFKYLLIKGVNKGAITKVVYDDTADIKANAKMFRGVSNKLLFPTTEFNLEGVHNSTPREDQYIFMDALFNAEYDVEVLASAFNMDKATFMGNLKLVDDFTTFDNDRFSEMIDEAESVEEVTDAELTAMAGVRAIIVDKEWFQIYDNLINMDESKIASGQYWNYFLNVWKTVSWSPFSNAVAFVSGSEPTAPASLSYTVVSKSKNDAYVIFALEGASPKVKFVQTTALTEDGIAVHPYGSVIIPIDNTDTLTLVAEFMGETYTGSIASTTNEGATITLTKSA